MVYTHLYVYMLLDIAGFCMSMSVVSFQYVFYEWAIIANIIELFKICEEIAPNKVGIFTFIYHTCTFYIMRG